MLNPDDAIDRVLKLGMSSAYGKLGAPRQNYGRVYRSGLWHLMKSDPHDRYDNWRGSFTPWVTRDTDPCDDWPFVTIGGEFVGFLTGYSFTVNNDG